jgi:hypothetical protein
MRHWVRNALANDGCLRIHLRGAWRPARLRIVDADPESYLRRMSRVHAAFVRLESSTPAAVDRARMNQMQGTSDPLRSNGTFRASWGLLTLLWTDWRVKWLEALVIVTSARNAELCWFTRKPVRVPMVTHIRRSAAGSR